MSERKHQYNCALNDPAPIIAGESARMGDINRAMNQCTCDAHQPFTSEEIKSLPSRVLIHGTPDGNKATLAWDDYSRLFATAAAAVERGVRETTDDAARALEECGIGAIFDEFTGPADAIRQMAQRINELESDLSHATQFESPNSGVGRKRSGLRDKSDG